MQGLLSETLTFFFLQLRPDFLSISRCISFVFELEYCRTDSMSILDAIFLHLLFPRARGKTNTLCSWEF